MRKCFLMSSLLLMLLTSASVFADVKIGQKAIDFSLPSLSSPDQTVKMKSYKQKTVLLNFWASWCKGCKKEMPFLNKLASDNEGKLTVIAVNIDNKKKKANDYIDKFIAKMGGTSKIKFVYNKDKSLPKAYELDAVPCSLLIKNGKIIKYYLGSFDEDNEKVLLNDVKKALK